MARYYPISPLFWADPKVRAWDERTTLLALYLLTCEHRNLEGLYRLPRAYVQADLGWSEKDVDRAMRRLLDDSFIAYDEAAEVVLVRKAMKYQAPKGTAQIRGAVNAIQEVPDTELLPEFVAVAERYAPDFRKALNGVVDTPSGGSR